jgi:hypothetical protein
MSDPVHVRYDRYQPWLLHQAFCSFRDDPPVDRYSLLTIDIVIRIDRLLYLAHFSEVQYVSTDPIRLAEVLWHDRENHRYLSRTINIVHLVDNEQQSWFTCEQILPRFSSICYIMKDLNRKARMNRPCLRQHRYTSSAMIVASERPISW